MPIFVLHVFLLFILASHWQNIPFAMHTVQLVQKEKFRACGVLCTTVHIEGVDIHFTVHTVY